jgi:hypothetical protein
MAGTLTKGVPASSTLCTHSLAHQVPASFERDSMSSPMKTPLSKTKQTRPRTPRIVLPVAQSNIQHVRQFMLSCVVPILAETFLRARASCADPGIHPTNHERTSGHLNEEAVQNDGPVHGY